MEYNREYDLSIYGDKIKLMLNNELIIDIDNEKDMKLAETRYIYSGGRYLILPNTERETKQIWKNNIVRGSIFLGLAFTIGMIN